MLQYVRSLREGNFHLYVETPWFFSMDHTHYSRWLPVHIRDNMVCLKDTHQSQFMQGHFTVQKTGYSLLSIALDQNHEQLNEIRKGFGGAKWLTETPGALQRWMIAGPEIERLINEFDGHSDKPYDKHHEQSPCRCTGRVHKRCMCPQ